MSSAGLGRDRVRVCALGAYAHRQPFAYPPIVAGCLKTIEPVGDPAAADVLVVAHTKDLQNLAAELSRLLALKPGLRLAMLSEEPFWDTVWGADPFARRQDHYGPEGLLPVTVLNHQTTDIFAFGRVPYFLLTDPRYIAHYRPLFARNAGLARADWAAHFESAQRDAAFVAAKRLNPRFAPSFPEHDVAGLCGYRSTLTAACRGENVLRMGEGWTAGPPRQVLADWHLDKLELLDMKVRYVSALENTHQRDYVSEKIFDAFATGSVPLYVADPEHRVRRVAPEGAWINLYGRAASDGFDAGERPSAEMIDAYVEAQDGLRRLFADPEAVPLELERMAAALTKELSDLAA